MKVCAHVHLGSANAFASDIQVHTSKYRAVREFEHLVNREWWGTPGDGNDLPTLELFDPTECAEHGGCDSACTWHDYPISRYTVGPRGGIVLEES